MKETSKHFTLHRGPFFHSVICLIVFNLLVCFTFTFRGLTPNVVKPRYKMSMISQSQRNSKSIPFNREVGTSPNFLDHTPDEHQRDAITTNDPAVLIIAGPGSGKTRVLSARLAHLLESGKCSPNEILVLSFTNSAANNVMKNADDILKNSVATVAGTVTHTFHSFCSSIIRKYPYLISKSTREMNIADEQDQLRIIVPLLRNKGYPFDLTFAKGVLRQIRCWKEFGLGYIGMRRKDLNTLAEKGAYELFPDYQTKLRSLSALDFGDLLLYTMRLFRNQPEILKQYRRKYRHILVDEFQDVSPAQYDILRMLALGSMTEHVDAAKAKDVQGTGTQPSSPNPSQIYSPTQGIRGGQPHTISPRVEELGRRLMGSNFKPPTISISSSSSSGLTLAGSSHSEAPFSFPRLGSDGKVQSAEAMSLPAQQSYSPQHKHQLQEEKEEVIKVNVFCAGDDDQSIYSWRGARVELMRRFHFDFPGARFMLFEGSYRLPEGLRRVAESLLIPIPGRINKAPPVSAGPRVARGPLAPSQNPMIAPHHKETASSIAAEEKPASLMDEAYEPSLATSARATQSRADLEIRSIPDEEAELEWLAHYLKGKLAGTAETKETKETKEANGDGGANTEEDRQHGHKESCDLNSNRALDASRASEEVLHEHVLRAIGRAPVDAAAQMFTQGQAHGGESMEMAEAAVPSVAHADTMRRRRAGAAVPNDLSAYSIAVLTRSQADLRRVAQKLTASGVPFRSRGFSVWMLPEEAEPLLHLLRLLANPEDDVAFEIALDNDVLLQSMIRKEEVTKHIMPIVAAVAQRRKGTLLDAARECVLTNQLNGRHAVAMGRFLRKYHAWSKDMELYFSKGEKGHKAVFDLLQSAFSQRWTPSVARAAGEMARAASEFDNLAALFAEIRQEGDFIVDAPAAAADERPLPLASSTASSAGDMGSGGSASVGSASSSGPVKPPVTVWIMVMHAAKGLEFDETVLPFWTMGNVPKNGSPEERRLAYVSLTRARERVLITYAKQRKAATEVPKLVNGASADNGRASAKALKASPFVLELLSLQDEDVSYEEVSAAQVAAMHGDKSGRSHSALTVPAAAPAPASSSPSVSATAGSELTPTSPAHGPGASHGIDMAKVISKGLKGISDFIGRHMDGSASANAQKGEARQTEMLTQCQQPRVANEQTSWEEESHTTLPSHSISEDVMKIENEIAPIEEASEEEEEVLPWTILPPEPNEADVVADAPELRDDVALGLSKMNPMTLTVGEINRLLYDSACTKAELKVFLKEAIAVRFGLRRGSIEVGDEVEGEVLERKALSKCTAVELGKHLISRILNAELFR